MEQFIENFITIFDDELSEEVTPSTLFKDLDEWSSLCALSVIAMADEEYGVEIKGDDIRKVDTIEDLYNLIQSKK